MWRNCGLLFFLIACLACSTSSNANTSAPGATEGKEESAADWKNLRDFVEVQMVGPDNVYVTQAKEFSVRVEAEQPVLQQLKIEKSDDALRIYREMKTLGDVKKPPADIFISMPTLNRVRSTGSGKTHVGKLQGTSLEIRATGSGDVDFKNVTVKLLDASIAGSGNLNVAGEAQTLQISIVGSGNFSGLGLKTEKGDVKALGSGHANFSSDGQVNAKILGSGNVQVKGSAKCDSVVMGSGKITCAP